MSLFLVNVLLAAMWVLLWGDLSLYTIVLGFAFGYAVLWLFARLRGHDTLWNAYGRRLFGLFTFGIYFFGQLVKSNWQIARQILSPGLDIDPRIIRYDVTGLSTAEITILSNAITLTPGTLVIDSRTRGDRTLLYIHCLFAEDRETQIEEIDTLRHHMERDVFFKGPPTPTAIATRGTLA
ncbi:MAG: Na+/H+ antiporter subunit E [Planctomycetota bacterium]